MLSHSGIMNIYRCILLTCLAVSTVVASSAYSGWSQTPSTQYHIQTDEGPERYFRYQTESGQYRKEKRLQDGTVIGSYGWVDADGYLRLRDYIADNAGYRILKSKTIFVGHGQPIENAVKSTKNVPAQAGVLVDSRAQQPASTPRPHTAYSAQSPTPPPTVYVSPNTIDVTDKPVYDFRPTVAPISASSISTYPFNTTYSPTYATTPYPSSTYLPSTHEVSTPSSVYELPKTDAPVVTITPNSIHDRYKSRYDKDYTSRNNFRNGVSANSIGSDYERVPSETRVDYYNPNSYRHADEYSNRRRLEAMARRRSGQGGYSQNQLGNGYDRQFALYDGVSNTNNGFRYYLPRQYHEEENSGSETRTGSFGYVDPFGIRRVIYYNTSPGSGFQHRKNNRYVGLNATPYDPRPT